MRLSRRGREGATRRLTYPELTSKTMPSNRRNIAHGKAQDMSTLTDRKCRPRHVVAPSKEIHDVEDACLPIQCLPPYPPQVGTQPNLPRAHICMILGPGARGAFHPTRKSARMVFCIAARPGLGTSQSRDADPTWSTICEIMKEWQTQDNNPPNSSTSLPLQGPRGTVTVTVHT